MLGMMFGGCAAPSSAEPAAAPLAQVAPPQAPDLVPQERPGIAPVEPTAMHPEPPQPPPAVEAPPAPRPATLSTRPTKVRAPTSAPAAAPAPNPAATLPATPAPRPTTVPADLLSTVRRDLADIVKGESPEGTSYPGLTPEDQRYAIAVIQGMRDSLARISAGDGVSAAVAPLLLMADRLRSLAPLEIVRMALCTRVDAFGVYDPVESKLVANRETNLVLYCELAGFHSRQVDLDMYETRLTQEATLTDATGQVLWTDNVHSFVDVCRNRRRDFYVARIIRLPASIPPGDHVLTVNVIDQYSKEVAASQMAVSVAPLATP